ncbi:hypothetical protein SLE2022_040470 [Rubroshorea leprosula]
MEEERQNFSAKAGPFPWLLITQYKQEHNFSIGAHGDIIKTIPELRDKRIFDYNDGWLTVHDDNGYSIFNPATSESIQFPPLSFRPDQFVSFSNLSGPPGNPDSMLILFEKNASSFIFCRIGDRQWTEQPASGDLDYKDNDGDYLISPVWCRGKLYSRTRFSLKIVEIERLVHDQFVIRLLPLRIPKFLKFYRRYSDLKMMESDGEVFIVNVALREGEWRDGSYNLEPTAVEVRRLDFSRMEWERVDRVKDRAFFLANRCHFSCPAAEPLVEESHLYFFPPTSKSFYSFNLEDQTIHVSFPFSNLPTSKCFPTWVMPRFSGETENDLVEGRKETGEISKHVAIKEEKETGVEVEGRFCELPPDILFGISRRLVLHDYTSFRGVNRMSRLAVPPIQWTSIAWDRFEFNDPLPPWLVFPQNNICNFIDPLRGQRYPMKIADFSLEEFRICYSKDGWCVILRENSMFLWNSFSKKIIWLPDMLHNCDSVVNCCFSTSPESSDCILVLACTENGIEFDIDYIFLEDREWLNFLAFNTGDGFCLTDSNTPVFHDGTFFFLGKEGNLGVFEDFEVFDVLQNPQCPCNSFCESYLLESKGKLLSVFVGSFGEWVRIFSLDISEMAWIELQDIGNQTLYVSRFSSFSMTATTPDMRNKVYFPRFSGNNPVYYSLDSKRFHSHGTEDVLRGIYNTNELLLGAWVELKWY